MACHLFNTGRCLQPLLFNRPIFGVHFRSVPVCSNRHRLLSSLLFPSKQPSFCTTKGGMCLASSIFLLTSNIYPQPSSFKCHSPVPVAYFGFIICCLNNGIKSAVILFLCITRWQLGQTGNKFIKASSIVCIKLVFSYWKIGLM